MSISSGSFRRFIERMRARGTVAVQPRMGWGHPLRMRQALQAIRAESERCIGTITLDSYTRVGDYQMPLECLRAGEHLNGYPLLSHSPATTSSMLEGVATADFPVQVRHGTPQPQGIFRRLVEVGLDATEGGPVSYCLPYGRTPLPVAMHAWSESCRILAGETEHGHIESFGGCLIGQLCPPSLLLAVGLLECLFFKQFGVTSVSLSYAQGPSYRQDRAALAVLRALACEYLDSIDWHAVVYTYMGLFPETPSGASRLIADSARLTAESGCERLIVKTASERRQIPPLKDNLAAIRLALACTDRGPVNVALRPEEQELYESLLDETRALIDTVLDLDADISAALLKAFASGILDIPYCLHPDNRGQTQAVIDEDGLLRWSSVGNMPIKHSRTDLLRPFTSDSLLRQLSQVAQAYDSPQPEHDRSHAAES
jgi:methylaspartate mutase epsilon subunit